MAESSLSIDWNGLRQEVGRFLGWSRTHSGWSAAQNTDFVDISKRALREFYYPAIGVDTPRHEWSFLRKAGTISLNTASSTYVLPDDFSGVILEDSITYNTNINRPPLTKVPEHTIRQLKSSDSQIASYPRYYAIRNKAHAPTTGQRYEMIVYPDTSANAVTLNYRYVYLPDVLTTTNKYPAGGALYSEVILAAHLAAAEAIMDTDTQGMYAQRFQTMLATAVRADMTIKADQIPGRTA